MEIDLKNKTALVCGASDGIGKAIAVELAASGAKVILLARNVEKLKAVQEQLNALGLEKHEFIVADFENNELVKNAADQVVKNFHVDILINNTGGPPAGLASNAVESEFLMAFHNHLINNHTLVKTLLPKMKEKQFGRIINIISTSVKQPLHNLGVSNTIRGAVANWSKTLANELAAYGITVNNILPGATATGRLASIIENKSKKSQISIDEASLEMLKEIPAQRFGKPEEIAYAACFLASDKAAYITGTNMVIDGGRTSSL